MSDPLETELISYFPEYQGEILKLLHHDQNFREVAEDYVFCRNEINQILRSESNKLLNQYRQTLQELEDELLCLLKENQIKKSKI